MYTDKGGNEWPFDFDSQEHRKIPFLFEHLNGKPEPKEWGPLYPKTLGVAVEKWRKLDKKRELTKDEICQWGAAVGHAIRQMNKPTRNADIPLHCTVQNTCRDAKGKLLDTTAEGEERRYQAYVARLKVHRRNADPEWLDKCIVAAFEAEFALEFSPTRLADQEAWITRKTQRNAKGRITSRKTRKAA